MEWEDIVQYHKNPPKHRIYREDNVQYLYESDKQTEGELYNKLFINNSNWVLTPNKYPYYFKDNTEHYIFWSKGNVDYGILESVLSGLGREYVYFENDSNNKSIKSISHAHVFLN
jgi:hypothetical protein